jgi:hypothetical protein
VLFVKTNKKEMKKILLIAVILNCVSFLVNAQESKFYVNKATVTSADCDCKTIKSIKVTIPLPSGLAAFDSYLLFINLSSLDVPTYISFDKKDIAAKLVGKKEYIAYLLKEDGTSDFTFDDVAFSKKDLCSTPRMWGMTEMVMEASGAGYKIIGSHWEDKWNEYYKKWESTKIDDWDEGVSYGSGSLTIKQAPLSDGFSDLSEIITVKAENTDSCSYSVSEEVDANGSLSIIDNSQEFKTDIYYGIWSGGENSYNIVKQSVLSSVGGKYQIGPVHNFYELYGMGNGEEKVLPGKSNVFKNVTINGTSYETISHCRTKTGFYATFYITRLGDYTILITSLTNEIFEFKAKGLSLMDGKVLIYQFELTDKNIERIDLINEKWLNATTYK